MIVLRNIAFYLTFFAGSVWYVLGALIAAHLAPARARGFCDRWSAMHRRACARLLGIHLVESGERPSGRAFYAIKHESMFEAIDLPHAFDFPALYAKQELFEIPGWGKVARNYGVIPVARQEGAKALRSMIREAQPLLQAGRPMVIFPEGRRVPHTAQPPLQAGFAALYKLLGLPVVPVAIDSGPLYHRWLKRPGTVRMHFGEPIPPGLPREEIEARVHAGINALNKA